LHAKTLFLNISDGTSDYERGAKINPTPAPKQIIPVQVSGKLPTGVKQKLEPLYSGSSYQYLLPF